MDIFFTIDEKYLQAVEEYNYGESAKSLQLLNEIIATDPLYARAYYHVGLICYYQLKDYQQAGYYLKTCIDLAPNFPDAYEHYIQLLAFLNMENALYSIKTKALQIPGVNQAAIWTIVGHFAERHQQLTLARSCYHKALASVTSNKKLEELEEGLQRIEGKILRSVTYRYSLA